MQEVFDKLRDLQSVLAKKFSVLDEIVEIPKALKTKEELLNRGKKIYIEKHERIKKTTDELKKLRIALDEAEVARETYEKQMELISTQREYEALEKEIKDASLKEQSLRKSMLAKEKYLDELSEQIEEHEQLMEIQEEEVQSETKKKDALLDNKNKEVKALEDREALLTPGIDESILFKFERIIKNKAGIGIVPIHGLVCQGCHMTLPVQFVNDVRKGEEFRFCPYCSRVLFWEEADVEELATSALQDSEIEEAGLSDFVDDDEFSDFM
ncbi:MAG: nucleic acid-binding protein [Spirochaetia bacterium]|nr:nucleic acid-binding protein [Spirochaetia bacterium]